jgi:inosose dehydratase
MDPQKIKLAIAPIAWSNDDLPELGGENTFEQCISEMALAGFSGCEAGNKFPKDPAMLMNYLEPRRLQICNAWFSTFFTNGHYHETLERFLERRDFLHTLGAKVVGCSEQGGSIQGVSTPVFGSAKPVFNDKQWLLLSDGINKLARLAGEKNMRVCLHHHMGTGVQAPAEIDRFMAMTDPEVCLLFDTGHLYFSEYGQTEANRILDMYINRIAHVHLKDIRPEVLKRVKSEDMSFLDAVRAGVFTVPGDGCLDFGYVFTALERAGYTGWMVVEAEQDPAKANPYLYACKARKYIREQTGL